MDNGCGGIDPLNGGSDGSTAPRQGSCFDSGAVGICDNAIPLHAWTVIRSLQKKGFDAYLVGGCVRDLLLKREPKDIDVVTSASPEQIKKMMKHCIIVGKHFPICQVRVGAFIVEISSFSVNDSRLDKSEEVDGLDGSNSFSEKDFVFWKNSMKRDFTINCLFFDPMTHRIYDYVNGLNAIRQNKICTVITAHDSFKESPVRILRGFRIAARLGFQFSKETSRAIWDLSSSIVTIPKAILMLEMNCMLSYGVAESSIRLLRKYGLLDILLPFQAAYISDQMKGRSSDRDLMLMRLLVNLDKLLSVNRPSHRTLWLALLAFHSALINCPQDPHVIRAFAGLLQFGTWKHTMHFLEQDVGVRASFVPETLGYSPTKLDNLMEQTSHLVSQINSSVQILTCLSSLQQSVARYREPSQFSGLVVASSSDRRRVLKIFEGLDSDLTSYERRRGVGVCGSHEICYKSLKDGDPDEVRFVLGKVIMDTMNDDLPCASVMDLADRSCPPLSTILH